jgi:hypothetical protein
MGMVRHVVWRKSHLILVLYRHQAFQSHFPERTANPVSFLLLPRMMPYSYVLVRFFDFY